MVRRVAHRVSRYAVVVDVTWRGHVTVAARPDPGSLMACGRMACASGDGMIG